MLESSMTLARAAAELSQKLATETVARHSKHCYNVLMVIIML